MFTWLNKQGVRSDEGFEVQFTSRNTAEYREGRRYLVVDVEGGGNVSDRPTPLPHRANFVDHRPGRGRDEIVGNRPEAPRNAAPGRALPAAARVSILADLSAAAGPAGRLLT